MTQIEGKQYKERNRKGKGYREGQERKKDRKKERKEKEKGRIKQ